MSGTTSSATRRSDHTESDRPGYDLNLRHLQGGDAVLRIGHPRVYAVEFHIGIPPMMRDSPFKVLQALGEEPGDPVELRIEGGQMGVQKVG